MKRTLEPFEPEAQDSTSKLSPFSFHRVDSRVNEQSHDTPKEVSTSPCPCEDGIGSKKLICFGALCDVATQVRHDPWVQLPQSKGLMHEGQAYVALEISFTRDSSWLKISDGEPFACLPSKIVLKLKRLMLSACIEVDAVTSTNALRKARLDWKKSGSSTKLKVDLNVYGHSQFAKTTAAILSSARLFLQPPNYEPRCLAYENPQYLRLPDLDEADFTSLDMPGSTKDSNEDTSQGLASEVEIILDHLPQPRFLREIQADERVITKLEKYQMEAVDFMTRREICDLPPSLSLWKLHVSKNGLVGYQHVITGAKSSRADDPLGGLLADEMGLGKTLSTLAVIVASLARALEFAISGTREDPTAWTNLVPSKSTLVVVPSALLLDSWEEEIDKHISPGCIAYYRYHSTRRRIHLSHLLQYDIVLTTYATISAEFRRGHSVLDRVEWYRIVLDEAHTIRNPTTNQYRAIRALPARIRWCLTGTPIQNTLEDLAALVQFIRVPLLDNISTFRKYVTVPILAGSSGRFVNLRRVLEALCLRRTKALLDLPDPVTNTHMLDFSEQEIEAYREFAETCKHSINLAVSGHTMKKANQHIIEALLRMRLFCNVGHVAFSKKWHKTGLPSDPEEALSFLQANGKATCVQCDCDISSMYQEDDRSSGSLTLCHHLICGECLPVYNEDLKSNLQNGRAQCSLCDQKGDLETFMIQPSAAALPPNPANVDLQSTKLKALVANIQDQGADDKSVVFSIWKKTLDAVAAIFEDNNITFYRIHGSIPASKRGKILSEFVKCQTVKVLLITFGTGAVGINKLVVANRIHIIEPQWNPSVESQAIGRILRHGQERSVTVIRYIIKRSVEEAVQSRQLRKLQLARGGFGLVKDEQSSKRIHEIMELLCPSTESRN